MFDPRTGGVAQAPRKTKNNGVKNLKGAQAIPEFLSYLETIRLKLKRDKLRITTVIPDMINKSLIK
jgi:hypothetical protein